MEKKRKIVAEPAQEITESEEFFLDNYIESIEKSISSIEKFAEQCPDSQRGKPLRDGAAKEKAGVSVCEKKRKKDGKTIYYKTKNQREKDSASKEERATARKNLGFAKKGRLSKINKAALENYLSDIRAVREDIKKNNPNLTNVGSTKPETKESEKQLTTYKEMNEQLDSYLKDIRDIREAIKGASPKEEKPADVGIKQVEQEKKEGSASQEQRKNLPLFKIPEKDWKKAIGEKYGRKYGDAVLAGVSQKQIDYAEDIIENEAKKLNESVGKLNFLDPKQSLDFYRKAVKLYEGNDFSFITLTDDERRQESDETEEKAKRIVARNGLRKLLMDYSDFFPVYYNEKPESQNFSTDSQYASAGNIISSRKEKKASWSVAGEHGKFINRILPALGY